LLEIWLVDKSLFTSAPKARGAKRWLQARRKSSSAIIRKIKEGENAITCNFNFVF